MYFRKDPRRQKQTRIFLRALADGAPTKEAKHLAGLPSGLNITSIMNHPLTQDILREMDQEESFRDKGLVKRLKEMWNHKRKRIQKVGDEVEVIHEDDTDMWKYSMDKVLTLRGYIKQNKETEDPSVVTAAGINFNVLQLPDESKKQKAAA